METPPAAPADAAVDVAAAQAIIDAALGERRDMLSEPEAKQLLSLYGIPVARTVVARDVDDAARLRCHPPLRVELRDRGRDTGVGTQQRRPALAGDDPLEHRVTVDPHGGVTVRRPRSSRPRNVD